VVYFLDASHMLHNAVPGQGWITRGVRVELKTNSGRDRLNILGAYSPDSASLEYIEDVTSCDAEMVCRLLAKLRDANPGKRIVVVLDNAKYNRARLVKKAAKRLRIELWYLPTYSPNLNLIERFWKFLKKKVARNKYHPTFAEFRTAVREVLGNLESYTEELSTLMTETFQLFAATK
jgi:transposase